MNTFLEILKITIPSLILFATVYFMMKKFFDGQLAIQSMKFRQEQMSGILPLKLQAYERLSLFVERISADNMSFRLASHTADANALSNAMMIAIQQEYEHNLSQQIYVSEKLWEIVSLAKDQMQNIIGTASDNIGGNGTPAELLSEITRFKVENNIDPISMVRKAIKKEIEIVL